MLNKILLSLCIVVIVSALGSALTCNVCGYSSKQPKSEQMCGNSTVNCTTGYCYTAKYTAADGTVAVVRSCANLDPSNKDCPSAEETCERRTKTNSLKSCVGACCTTDNCNNYTPSSASGMMATKFILCLIVLAGFLFA